MTAKARALRRQPQRTCIVCRQTSDKRSLVRLVRTLDHGVRIDERGKVPGRGAYLCRQESCWQAALHGDVLPRALGTELSDAERLAIAGYLDRVLDGRRRA